MSKHRRPLAVVVSGAILLALVLLFSGKDARSPQKSGVDAPSPSTPGAAARKTVEAPADPTAAREILSRGRRLTSNPMDRVAGGIQAMPAGGAAPFVLRDRNASAFFAPGQIGFTLSPPHKKEGRSQRVGLQWGPAGASDVNPRPEGPLAGKLNRMVGDRSTWAMDQTMYSSVVYEGIKPGIDMIVESQPHGIHYVLQAAPGADLANLSFHYRGADDVRVSEDGTTVEVLTTLGKLTETGLHCYQETGSGRKDIGSRYIQLGPTDYAIALGEHDPKLPVTIDPSIGWSTFLGANLTAGADYDDARAIAVDTSGNVYLAAVTQSADFPNTTGAVFATLGDQDVTVSKINSTGTTLLWSSILGGTSYDEVDSIALDTAAPPNVYITGYTESPNFPTSATAYKKVLTGGADVYVTKLNSAGTAIVWSTLLGGSNFEYPSGLCVDASGNAYVAGTTYSADFPTPGGLGFAFNASGNADGFVTKITSGGAGLTWSSILGGSSSDYLYALAIDTAATPNVYVAGNTSSSNFPKQTPFQPLMSGSSDAFVTKINGLGTTMAWSSFYGGTSDEYPMSLVVDTAAPPNVFMAGYTYSATLPASGSGFKTSNAGGADAFVTKILGSGASVTWTSFLGGTSSDYGYSVGIDTAVPPNVYLAGQTASPSFPLPAGNQVTIGGWDSFVAKFSNAGNTTSYIKVLGGTNSEYFAKAVVDTGGNVYFTGTTYSNPFPTVGFPNLPLRTTVSGSQDMYVTKLTSTGATSWSDLLGGSSGKSNNDGRAVAIDSATGNIFVAGTTDGSNFPLVTPGGAYASGYRGGYTDTFITKYNPSGSAIIWSTCLGGNDEDGVGRLAVDAAGNAVLCGYTYSEDFPLLGIPPFQVGLNNGTPFMGNADGFVAKFNTTGGLAWTTFIGGTDYEQTYGIATDSSNNVYVTGLIYSFDYPAPYTSIGPGVGVGNGDAYVIKMDPNGNRLYTTLFGGSDTDYGNAIKVDNGGNAYVGGYTYSTNFPTPTSVASPAYQTVNHGSTDLFVAKLNPAGSALVYGTYIGGSSYEYVNDLDIDISGNAYVTGYTGSSGAPFVFPTTPGAFKTTFLGSQQAYVTQVNPDGTGLVWSTFLGGSNNTYAYTLKVDTFGNVFVGGTTYSSDLPMKNAINSTANLNGDAFIMKINASGATIGWSSYIGGSSWEGFQGVALKGDGTVVLVGTSSSPDYPFSGALDTTMSRSKATVMRLNNSPPSVPAVPLQHRSSDDSALAVGDWTKDGSIVVKATLTDPEEDQVLLRVELKPINVAFDGTTGLTSGSLVSNGSRPAVTVTLPGPPAMQEFHWRCQTVDAYGHASAWVSFGANLETDRDVGADILAPVVALSSPTTLATYYTQTSPLALGGTANDNLSGVSAVAWTRQGGLSGGATGTLAWTIASIPLVPNADNTVVVTATDPAGNAGTFTLHAIYDTTKPTGTISTPAPNFLTNSNTVNIGGTANDALPGAVASVTWVNSGGGSGVAALVGTSWSASVLLAAGANTITVTITDLAGNTQALAVSGTYDNVLPAISITNPLPPSATTSAGSIVIVGSATDANGIQSLTWTNPSGPGPTSGVATGFPGTWTSSSINLSAGSNLITFTAKDGANNTNPATISVYSDVTAPTVSITIPNGTGSYSTGVSTVDLGGAATDDLAVSSVNWTNSRGGSGFATLTGPLNSKTWSALAVPLAAGSNIITVISTDSVGRTSPPAIITVDFVTTAPALAVTNPPSATFVTSASSILIQGNAADATVSLTSLTVTNTANGTSPTVTVVPGLPVAAPTVASFSATVNLVIGTNTINVVAGNGSLTTTAVLTIICDPFVPAVTITTPTGGSNFVTSLSTLGLSGVASDNRGVTQVSWTNSTGGSGLATLTGPPTSLTWSIPAVGLSSLANNHIVVTASDDAGNTTTDFIDVSSDGTNPGVQITLPAIASTYTTTAASIGVSGTGSDNATLASVTWTNAATGGTGTATGTLAWSVASVALNAGANPITVTATDAAGNTAHTSITIYRDTALPTVGITSPTSGGSLSTSSASIAIGGIAADDITVVQVDWQNVSVPSGTVTGTASGTTAWAVASISLDPGLNTITVRSKDGANQFSTVATLLVTYDPTLPTISFTTPASSPFNTTSTPANVVGISNDNIGVVEVKWSNQATGGTGIASGTTNWSAQVPLTSGSNVIQMSAKDAAGNIKTASTTVVYDPAAPVISIAVPTSGTSFTTGTSPLAMSGAASDDVTVMSVAWVNSDGSFGSAVYGAGAWSTSVTLSPGSNVITVTATDEVGRTGSTSLTVVYDPSPPQVTITSPTSNPTFLATISPISIGGVASDNLAVQTVTWTNAGNATSGTASGVGLWNISSVVLAPGPNLITVQATDAVGNIGSASITVIYDATPPVLAVVTPAIDPVDPIGVPFPTSNRPIAIDGTVSDNLNVASVTWVNSKGGGGAATLGGTQPGAVTWSASVGLLSGNNDITVTAIDDHGNTTTVTFRIAFTPESLSPAIQITGPGTGTVTSANQIVDLSGTSDDNVGVVTIIWKNVTTGAKGVATFVPGLSAPWTASVPLTNGANVIRVTAIDDAGNMTTDTITVNFVSPLDTTDPVLITVSPVPVSGIYDATTAPQLMVFSVTDDVGIASVVWQNPATGGSACATFVSGIPTASTWSASLALAVGANAITVTATDAAGNIATDSMIVNFVPGPGDTIVPAISITSHPTSVSTSVSTPILDFAGTSSDNVDVAEVVWFDAASSMSGSTDGTTSWTGTLVLVAGVNVITVRAYDTSGNASTSQMTVIYTPPVYVPPPVHIAAGACGLLGLEILLPLALVAALRRRRERRKA